MRFAPYEDRDARTLAHLPLTVRRLLDETGVALSLSQWQALPLPLRRTLGWIATASAVPGTPYVTDLPDILRESLAWLVSVTAPADNPGLKHRTVDLPWRSETPPEDLATALTAAGFSPGVWSALDTDGRFALVHAHRRRDRDPDRWAAALSTLPPVTVPTG